MQDLNLRKAEGDFRLGAGPPQKIAHPTTQSLHLKIACNGLVLGIATGFVVETRCGPHLITNRHVVTGRDHVTHQFLHESGALPEMLQIMHHRHFADDPGALGAWVARNEPLYDSEQKPLWHEHPTLGEKADFIALPLTPLTDVALFPYNPAEKSELVVGPADHVSVIGFPFGKAASAAFPIWATGFIASDPVFDYDQLPVMLIDCRSRKGQSGSPVVAYRHTDVIPTADGRLVSAYGICRFLGVYSGRINAESDLGMVWKPSAILELLGSL